MSSAITSLLPARPPAAALELSDRIILWSMREWLRAALAGDPVTLALKSGLEGIGLPDMAGPVACFMEEATQSWPERLRLFPTGCGCPISYDEWLLLGCIGDAARKNRCAFDLRLCEMLAAGQRASLWRAASRLAAATGNAIIC